MSTKKIILIILLASLILILRTVVFNLRAATNQGKLEGEVASIPKIQKDKLVFNVGKFLVSSPKVNLHYQDQVKLEGEGRDNKFKAIKVEIIPRSGPQKFLTSLRFSLNSKIEKSFPQPQAALLSGILLGIKTNLPSDFNQALINTGTIHVVVVSGYNIALIGSFFLVFASFIGRKKATVLALISIVCYSLLVGASAPTLRAVLMGSVSFSAVLLGRRTLAFYNLILVAYFMLMFNPTTVVDISFQLTFAATLGIIVFNKPLVSFLRPLPEVFRDSLAATLAAQALVIPLLFYYFGSVSLISPLVNALVLWTVPLATVLGFVFLLLSYLSEFLAKFIAEVLMLPLSSFTFLVSYFGNDFKFLVVTLTANNLITAIGYYLLLTGIVGELLIKKRIKTKN